MAGQYLTASFEMRPTKRKAAFLERVRKTAEDVYWQVLELTREAARGLREFNKSLETRDPREAQKRWANVHGKFETYLSELEAIAQGPDGQAPIDVQQRIGRDFLKRHGLAYVPLAELRQRNEQHGSRREPSELEQRLALVEDELGIPVDDEEERDDAINQSPPLLHCN